MSELYHYGIKGQEWGKRRFQDYAGKLTAAGRERYGIGLSKAKYAISTAKKTGRFGVALGKAKGEYLAHYGVSHMQWGVRRWQNPDGSLTQAGRIHYGVKKIRENRITSEYVKSKKAFDSLKSRQFSDMKANEAYSKLKANDKFSKLSAKYIKKYGQDSYDSLVKGLESRYQNSNRLVKIKRKDGGTALVDRNVLEKGDTKSLIRAYVNLGYTSRDIEKKLDVSPEEVIDAVDSVSKMYYDGGIGVGKIKAKATKLLVGRSETSSRGSMMDIVSQDKKNWRVVNNKNGEREAKYIGPGNNVSSQVKSLRNAGYTYREIEQTLGISSSKIAEILS